MSVFITNRGERLPYSVEEIHDTWAMVRFCNDGPTVLIISVEWEGKIRRLDVQRTLAEGETIDCHIELSAFKRGIG